MIQKLEQKKTRKNRKAAKQNAGQLTLCIEGLKELLGFQKRNKKITSPQAKCLYWLVDF